jgi:flavodoxin
MKTLIVYGSRSGNTALVADVMAGELKTEAKDIATLTSHGLEDCQLVGLGSGIYTMQHERQIVEMVDWLPPDCRVFIFSTGSWVAFSRTLGIKLTHWRLRHALRRRNIQVIGEWSCPGHVKQMPYGWLGLHRGHPNEADLREAAGFARRMSSSLTGLGQAEEER